MAQGDKATQRKWWLSHGFNYRDNKYHCGNATSNYITLRLNTIAPWDSESAVLADLESGSTLKDGAYVYYYSNGKNNIVTALVNKTNKTIKKLGETLASKYLSDRKISVVPYNDLWPAVSYQNDSVVQIGRVNRNETGILPLLNNTTLNDSEAYIYSANCLTEINGIAPFCTSRFAAAPATRLQTLDIGDEDIFNIQLINEGFALPQSDTLKSLNMCNCVNFGGSITIRECHCIEDIDLRGTKITSVSFPNGGRMKKVYYIILSLKRTIVPPMAKTRRIFRQD